MLMLNSAEQEILNAHTRSIKYQRIQLLFFQAHNAIKLFFLFINVKMPTIVGILKL